MAATASRWCRRSGGRELAGLAEGLTGNKGHTDKHDGIVKVSKALGVGGNTVQRVKAEMPLVPVEYRRRAEGMELIGLASLLP
jgi:hypothetical protein